jgi:DNA replication protein DnaC
MAHSEIKKPESVPYTDTCATHGEFTSEMVELAPGFPFRKGCPECIKIRTAEREAEDAAKARQVAKALADRALAKLRAAGVPARYEAKALDTYTTDKDGQARAKAACQALVDAMLEGREPPNLILTGLPGTGKSHLSCGIILALYGSKKVKRVDLPDLIREIRATWRKDSEHTEETVLDWYGSLDLLILEEVGTGSGSDDERARIFQVINRRYEAMLPTVVVTNLSIPELKTEMGERVIDRLREGERSLVVFDWESARGAS